MLVLKVCMNLNFITNRNGWVIMKYFLLFVSNSYNKLIIKIMLKS